ncbi:hypothetical protein [Gluconobacter sp. Dm-44]|uniref:hypothetical protein n=1 Tax=Gluconobacter sp. Dm-44 TaxID=2799805 RepID=UPI001B8C0F6D|nr:hypothetical protein [Gluconobacter sp. Dm-44]MBS1060429.1 hypothetical protein [Gluconobacter sp. Dm-44]
MGSKVPSDNIDKIYFDYNSQETLNEFHILVIIIKRTSEKLAKSFAVTPSEVQKIYLCFREARRLASQIERMTFTNIESENMKRECLNCFAILEAGLCLEEDSSSLPD